MKLLISAVAFFVIGIGLSVAYAEEAKYVDVDPDCNETVTQDGNVTHHLLECKWYKQDLFMGATQTNLTDAETQTLEKVREQRESDNYNPAIDLGYLTEHSGIPKNTVSDSIPESCTRNNPSPSDIEECNLDTKMSFCERGIQSTSPIQQYEYFNVSEYTPRDDLQIDLNNSAKPIVKKLKAYEECRAELQLILDLNKTHYVGISKEVAKGEYNPYHRDFVTTELTFPSQEKVTEGRLISEHLKAENRICKMPYTDKFLKEAGCDLSHKYDGEYKIHTGMTEFERRLMTSSPMLEWFKYLETDGENYYPAWIKKHSVTITGMSPNAQLEINVPRD